MNLILIMLLAGIPVILIIVWPLVAGQGQKDNNAHAASRADLEALLTQRDAVYSTISDLDFDFETGKLREDDYTAQREVWVQRGISVLKQIDALPADAVSMSTNGDGPTDVDDEIEAAIRARRHTA